MGSLTVAALSPSAAIAWLASRGARPWLVRHHELVVEAAEEIVSRLAASLTVRFERDHVLVGAAVHDAGKIVHPEEMSAPGALHEPAGEAMLREAGFPPHVARAAVTHARWSDERATIEDRLIALADKLWKGKRDDALEQALAREIAASLGRSEWEVFSALDEICEAVASTAGDRLARSRV